jgi:putative two-component system response regulator
MTRLNSVLIIDDEPSVRNIMARWVTALGLEPETAGSAEEALASLRNHQYDVVIIDLLMPGHDGLWLADRLQRDHPSTAVVIATAQPNMLDTDSHKEPLKERPIADFLFKPFRRERFAMAVDRGRQWRRQTLEDRQWNARLAFELRDRTNDICAQLQDQAAGVSELDLLSRLMLARVPDAHAHSQRVARFANSIARQMGVDESFGDVLEIAAKMHDVGKLAMPEPLLTKPSPLTPGETAIMRRHVDAGVEILAATRALTEAAPIVHTSHEWFGGAGYPRQLVGIEIPLASRIIAVADAYDAMTQDRCYRTLVDSADAVGEMLRCCPAQFDPEVVHSFLSVLGRH